MRLEAPSRNPMGKSSGETCQEFPLPGLLEGNFGELSWNAHSRQLFCSQRVCRAWHPLDSVTGLIREAMLCANSEKAPDILDQVEAMPDPCALGSSKFGLQVLLPLRYPASRLTWPRILQHITTVVVSRHATAISALPSLIGSPPNCGMLQIHANPPNSFEDAVKSAPRKCSRHPQTKGSIEDAKLSASEEEQELMPVTKHGRFMEI